VRDPDHGPVLGRRHRHIIRVQYGIAQREDLTVTFVEPASLAAVHELRALPGVLHAEPFRSIPVRLRHGHRRYDTGIEGIPEDAYLRRVIDTRAAADAIPARGHRADQRLAEILRARPGR
jgi:putative ABC transport system permease protein